MLLRELKASFPVMKVLLLLVPGYGSKEELPHAMPSRKGRFTFNPRASSSGVKHGVQDHHWFPFVQPFLGCCYKQTNILESKSGTYYYFVECSCTSLSLVPMILWVPWWL